MCQTRPNHRGMGDTHDGRTRTGLYIEPRPHAPRDILHRFASRCPGARIGEPAGKRIGFGRLEVGKRAARPGAMIDIRQRGFCIAFEAEGRCRVPRDPRRARENQVGRRRAGISAARLS